MPGSKPGLEKRKIWIFDPGIIIDDKGDPYLYFGGAHPYNSRFVKLKKNLVELGGPVRHQDWPGFFEASFVHRYNGRYYFSYSGFHFEIPTSIEYVTSDRPDRDFSEVKLLMSNPPDNRGDNHHHSIFEFEGQWYFAYHNRTLAYMNNEPDLKAYSYLRNVALEELSYDENGDIIPIVATRDGVRQRHWVDAFSRNEAETMAASHGINTIQTGSDRSKRAVSEVHDGDWVCIKGVDFGKDGAGSFSATASTLTNGGSIEVHISSPDGFLLGTLPIGRTGGWDDWKEFSTTLSSEGGVFDIYLVFKGGSGELFRLDSWTFGKK